MESAAVISGIAIVTAYRAAYHDIEVFYQRFYAYTHREILFVVAFYSGAKFKRINESCYAINVVIYAILINDIHIFVMRKIMEMDKNG